MEHCTITVYVLCDFFPNKRHIEAKREREREREEGRQDENEKKGERERHMCLSLPNFRTNQGSPGSGYWVAHEYFIGAG